MSARKHLEEIPNSSGIYQIRCNQNGKIYVGSATDLRARWRAHRRDLCNGAHVNHHLQQAWDLYGEASFAFTVLKHVEPPRLLVREQDWIELTGCSDRRIGFNMKLQATSFGYGIGRTWSGFRDPAGNPVTIVNLSDFCRRNRLDFPSMHRLSKPRWQAAESCRIEVGRTCTAEKDHRPSCIKGLSHRVELVPELRISLPSVALAGYASSTCTS
jgi:GIY-YIG catalytic domain